MGKTILITGGAGFIGINSAKQFIADGWRVIIFDNLSRRGSEKNIEYLAKFYSNFEFIKADVAKDFEQLAQAADRSQVILHLAGQVAVTSSVQNPIADFEANALGTLNVLEAARKSRSRPAFIYSSTNKVYGGMEDVVVAEAEKRYFYQNLPFGISENRGLDFHSPYGCSKGSGDQYVHDYARIYNLSTVVFRQSCIYGPHQFGLEDQGWLAWFTIATLAGKPLTIYGDGKQVRDILYVDDLVSAYKFAISNPNIVRGKIYNIGGGPENTLSLLELISELENILGKKIEYRLSGWRPGDQRVYISDIRKIKAELGWQPAVSPKQGIKKLVDWVKDNQNLFS